MVQETGNYAPPNRCILYFIFFGERSRKFIPATAAAAAATAGGSYALMAKVSARNKTSHVLSRSPSTKYRKIGSDEGTYGMNLFNVEDKAT